VVVIPDTGLAPGLTNILAHWAVEGWDKTSWVRIRVGGVPVHPEPPLGYQLVFSTEGLINEYVEDAQVMRRGRATTTSSLTEVEPVRFPPPFGLMEAFHTSGGASTLVTTLKGRVKDLDYKTIRYPGHCVRMAVLKDLGLFSDKPRKVGDARVRPRALTAKLLEARLPHEGEDAVLVLVRAEKAGGPQRRRVRIQLIDRFDEETGLTAMARCTAFPSACIAWMIGQGVIDVPGVHAQESVVPARKFIAEMRKAGLRIRRASG
jgi:lysine 6-dehydrogenase